jgi:hypothetical protein
MRDHLKPIKMAEPLVITMLPAPKRNQIEGLIAPVEDRLRKHAQRI